MRTFAPWVNVHQRTSTTEEALNKQVDEMTEPVNVSQQLSQPSQLCNGRMKGVAMMAERELCMCSNAWTPFHQTDHC